MRREHIFGLKNHSSGRDHRDRFYRVLFTPSVHPDQRLALLLLPRRRRPAPPFWSLLLPR